MTVENTELRLHTSCLPVNFLSEYMEYKSDFLSNPNIYYFQTQNLSGNEKRYPRQVDPPSVRVVQPWTEYMSFVSLEYGKRDFTLGYKKIKGVTEYDF